MILTRRNAELLHNNEVWPMLYDNEVYLCKEILPYTIKWRGHRYDFTGCTVYVKMTSVEYYTDPRIMPDNGKVYHHPHVFSDNKICLGSFSGKEEYSLVGAIKTLNQCSQILVSGHSNEGSIAGLDNTGYYPGYRGGFCE